METYAFLRGQNAAITKITEEFPGLKNQIWETNKKIKDYNGEAEKNILKFLHEELNNSHITQFQARLDSLLRQQIQRPIAKEEFAIDFLLQAQERTKNIRDKSISKGILSFKYHGAPHKEIMDGHIDSFESAHHPKAENVSIKIPIPKSWLAEQADMPHTIQQFTSYNGTGKEKLLILVYELPGELKDCIMNKNSIVGFLSPRTTLIRTEDVKLGETPALMSEVEEIIECKGRDMKVRIMQFMAIKDQKLYCLQGSVGPAGVNQNLKPMLLKYEPLFRLVAARTRLEKCCKIF
ncbi:hypothetical protein [Flavobacterium ustbae]|uniref:hypothetical protein n=1 Tax=Flavobacterium ustbae TaxID=2488790 RepID=UPI000F786C20|nr:hypothetical protein [Flavobacterium ustbae]